MKINNAVLKSVATSLGLPYESVVDAFKLAQFTGEKNYQAKRIVLTGGPSSGKTTILSALREEFGNKVCFVPEVATMLLSGGFPVPGKDLEWSEEWQSCLQAAVLPLQRAIEDASALVAGAQGAGVIICDRGTLDGAAYTPGGIKEFCDKNKLVAEKELTRYNAVIHLESLSVVCPEKYGNANNETRFEPLERAQQLELATKAAWQEHEHHTVIDGKRGIDGKIAQVIGIVKYVLSEEGGGTTCKK